jgi:hypothetical protein
MKNIWATCEQPAEKEASEENPARCQETFFGCLCVFREEEERFVVFVFVVHG